MGDVAEDLDMRMADGDFATVLCGSNKQMRYALELRRLYRVEAMPSGRHVSSATESAFWLCGRFQHHPGEPVSGLRRQLP